MKRTTTITVRLAALLVAGSVLAATPIALGSDSRWTWTESKAEQIARKQALLRFPRLGRASVEEELRTKRAYFRVLELVGFGEDSPYAVIYHDLAHRYGLALAKVQGGLAIAKADCTGSGATARRQFRQFRCTVTSEAVEVPSVTIIPSETGGLPAVVEGTPSRAGPYQALLNLQVIGKSRMSYRQVG